MAGGWLVAIGGCGFVTATFGAATSFGGEFVTAGLVITGGLLATVGEGVVAGGSDV